MNVEHFDSLLAYSRLFLLRIFNKDIKGGPRGRSVLSDLYVRLAETAGVSLVDEE